jgi:hypothetical protein
MRTLRQLAAKTSIAKGFSGSLLSFSMFRRDRARNKPSTTPVAPLLAKLSAAPCSISAMTPSNMKTPKTTAYKLSPRSLASISASDSQFETPQHTLQRSVLGALVNGDGRHLWAPHRISSQLPKLAAIRRFSDSSSDEDSPFSVPNQQMSNRLHVQWLQQPSRTRYCGADSSSSGGGSPNNLVCNLVERFNNAQLYDGINDSP